MSVNFNQLIKISPEKITLEKDGETFEFNTEPSSMLLENDSNGRAVLVVKYTTYVPVRKPHSKKDNPF